MVGVDTATWFRWFAATEAAGSSPSYEAASLAVAADDEVLAALAALPSMKRQPNLLFAACRYLGMAFEDTDAVIAGMLERWDDVAEVIRTHSTQTNEPARTATILPLLAQLPQPLALVEVGASAGLCLHPDRYRIRYDDAEPVGPPESPVRIEVSTQGTVPVPAVMPTVAWRGGVDLHPLDVRRPEDLDWLLACVWPEHRQRRERLLAASQIASGVPVELLRGDLVATIDELLAEVPAEVTPVVFHSAVLAYLDESARRAFAEKMLRHDRVVWISNEGPGVVPGLVAPVGAPHGAPSVAHFVVGVGGARVAAVSDPHGAWLTWIGRSRGTSGPGVRSVGPARV